MDLRLLAGVAGLATLAGRVNGVGPIETDQPESVATFTGVAAPTCRAVHPKTVLIESTHDGGVWWYPQGRNGFSGDSAHQGKAFADYLRSRGHTVVELGRGQSISADSMMSFPVIVRAAYYESASLPGYTASDLAAYDAYTACPRTLVVLAEYKRPGEKDELVDLLGIPLTGSVTGAVGAFSPHALTAGVDSIRYVAGSYLANESSDKIQVLGRVATLGVMGILTGRQAKVFFIGDTNGVELMPQPFIANLLAWGF